MTTLISSIKLLEQIIIAHRSQTPIPPNEDLIAEIDALIDTNSSPTTIPHPSTPTASKPLPPQLWRFQFMPKPELAARGINVNTIRTRLEQLGQIVASKPLMVDGDLAFEFIVATTAVESTFTAWQKDGITYNRQELATTAHHAETSTITTPPTTTEEVPLKSLESVNHTKDSEFGNSTTANPTALVPANMVRVDMARLDELMRLVGELVTARARQANYINQLKSHLPSQKWRALRETNSVIERELRDLRQGIMRVRLVPVGVAFERMKFVIRDLMNAAPQKQVQLELNGAETEIDKFVVDKMIEPLLHLVRNAVSHGIESCEQRIAQGKLPKGKIRLSAYTAGEAVMIEVADDGNGISWQAVTHKAHQLGLLDENEENLDETRLLDILCQPGFTTQEQVNLASGRGIGMDVVKSILSELGGSMTLNTQVGQGTCFTIRLPLTLAITDALIVMVGEQRFAVPRLAVREVIEVQQQAVTHLGIDELIQHRNNVLPLWRLSHLFHLKEEKKNTFYVLVVGEVNGIGIVVDRVLGEQEIVVRALHDPLVQITGIVGASELGDGRVVLILDVTALTRRR
jgi:two-component system chemotaxis sensor kinase CheA